eukprot:1770537-Pleurochrysis_carterae.AAC.2
MSLVSQAPLTPEVPRIIKTQHLGKTTTKLISLQNLEAFPPNFGQCLLPAAEEAVTNPLSVSARQCSQKNSRQDWRQCYVSFRFSFQHCARRSVHGRAMLACAACRTRLRHPAALARSRGGRAGDVAQCRLLRIRRLVVLKGIKSAQHSEWEGGGGRTHSRCV